MHGGLNSREMYKDMSTVLPNWRMQEGSMGQAAEMCLLYAMLPSEMGMQNVQASRRRW
jgi:hypothetical protein